MEVGDLYFLARQLKGLAEQALGATADAVDAIPSAHQLVLGFALQSPGSTVGEIARGLSLAQSAVSTAVAGLRDQGLLSTDVDPGDRRRTRVSPSPRLSRWASGHLHRDAADVLAPVLGHLTTRQRDEVLSALSRLCDAFRRNEAAPSTGLSPRRNP